MQKWARSGLVLALAATTGCAGLGMGTLEEVLGGMGGLGMGSLRGRIERVDTRRGELDLRTSRGDRERVDFDSRTEVVYRNRRYSVRDLDRGDEVSIRLRQDRRGDAYAERIQVERSAGDDRVYDRDRDRRDRDRDRDRDHRAGRVESLEGRVGWIDHQRAYFQLRSERGDYTVSLPYTLSRSTMDRFRRLRSGDRVRVDGMLDREGRIELERFR